MFLPYVILVPWCTNTSHMLTRQYALNPLKTEKEILDFVRWIPHIKGETLKSLYERLEWGSAAAVISSTLFFYPQFSDLAL